MRVITSGPNLDIDAYAGIVAYAEFLRLQGQKAVAASSAEFNATIPLELQKLHVQFDRSYQPAPSDTFTLVDVSNPDYFDQFVDLNHIEEIIDHHLGFEQIWADRPHVKTDIEFIGAACTQIFERWQRANLLAKMSPESAKLLASGILDNTLNFGAQVTTPRDHKAYANLANIAGLDRSWPEHYFTSCEQSIITDLSKAINSDTKVLSFKTLPDPVSVGQLVVWDEEPILRNLKVIQTQLSTIRPNWFMNLISLKDHCSYFVTTEPDTQKWLSDLLNVKFEESVATANRPWLRKEIIKQDLQIFSVS